MGLHRVLTMQMTRLASDVNATVNVTGLGGCPQFAVVTAFDNANANVNSQGWDNGLTSSCQYTTEVSFLITLLGALGVGSLTKVINTSSLMINNAGNGWSAKISGVIDDGCQVTWTKIGTGRDITVNVIAIL